MYSIAPHAAEGAQKPIVGQVISWARSTIGGPNTIASKITNASLTTCRMLLTASLRAQCPCIPYPIPSPTSQQGCTLTNVRTDCGRGL
eukprot:8920532-Pyramimonas_sp.AAC.1